MSDGKEQVILALKNSILGNDTAKLKEVATFLQNASKHAGYSMTLMEIVDDPNNPVEIKLAALIQLKNTIKFRWAAKKFEMLTPEKDAIKNAVLLAFIRCAKDNKLIKLYKEVLAQIVGNQYKTWMPVNPILQKIRSDQDLLPVLHALIAIASSFEFSITEEERGYFFEFLKSILPDLHALVQRNHDSALIYLCIKFIWKAVHYDLSDEVKLLMISWMPLVHAIVNLSNPEFETKFDETQTKDSPEFYYFHSKKWATRILLRFFQKHAKSMFFIKNQKNKEFSNQWYGAFGKDFITALINQFAVPTIKKVRYFQLKCMQSLITEKPKEMTSYAELFQYDILLRYMKLQPEDEELANSDPLDFLSKEDEPSINFTNLKRVATDVWIAFAQIGSKVNKKTDSYEPGPIFFQNMAYLQQKLESQNMVEKQLSMYIICQLRVVINRCKQMKQMLPTLISKYVIPEFKNEIMFLRARAVDIFHEFSNLQFDMNVIRSSVEGIYICLTKDNYPLVRIKAASAFNCILKHKAAKDLVRPLLKDILTVYLQLLEKYDLESLVNSLESIVEDFSNQIGPFAHDLTRYLSKLFMKLFNKDIEQNNKEEYDGEAELAASGCLKTITQIIQSPISQETVVQMQPEITTLLQFLFTPDALDYVEDALLLLNGYLFKVQKITPAIWFYYQVVIYSIVGIPKEMWAMLEKLPISVKQRQILEALKSEKNVDLTEQSMPVIRNYIRKGTSTMVEHQDAYNTNLFQLLFYLVKEIYNRGPNQYSGEIQMTCCTALMIYLLENYQNGALSDIIYVHIWEIAKYNIQNVKSKILKILNSQLLGMMLWSNPNKTLELVLQNNLLTQFLKELASYESKYEEPHERMRVILGMSTLLTYYNKQTEISSKLPEILGVLVKLINKNAGDRILRADPSKAMDLAEYNEDEDEDEDIDDLNFESEDDEDFWEEQYDDNYISLLDEVDELHFFEQAITKIKSQSEKYYQFLVDSLDGKEYQEMMNKLSMAALALKEKVEDLPK